MTTEADESWVPMPADMTALVEGQLVRHASGGPTYLISWVGSDQVVAVRTIQIENPTEWVVAKKRP